MGKFVRGKIYVIVLESQITNEMVNRSISRTLEEMPTKTVASGVYRIIEFEEPGADIFMQYTWLDASEVIAAWEALV